MSSSPPVSQSIPIPSSSTASSPLPPSSPPPPHATSSSSASTSRPLSRLWDRIQASSPVLSSPFASTSSREYQEDTPEQQRRGQREENSLSRPASSRHGGALSFGSSTTNGAGGVGAEGPRVEAEPLVSRLRGSVDRLSGSWPERFVPRWGSSKELERARALQLEAEGEGGPLDGEEGVMVVDDEACYVDWGEGKVDFLSSLPHEISLYILLHLPFQSLLTASTVSHQWRALAIDNVLWRDLFHQEKRWRIREPTSEELEGRVGGGMKRAAESLSRAGSKRSVASGGEVTGTTVGTGTGTGSRISRRLTDMMADLGSLSLTSSLISSSSSSHSRTPSQADDLSSSTSSLTSVDIQPPNAAPAPLTPRRATAALLPTNVFATPPSSRPSLSRTSSSSITQSALAHLPPSLGPSRRPSLATLAPLAPVPSPSLSVTPSAPLALDWPRLYRDRWVLEQRWKKGRARSTWMKGHEDSVYCLQVDEGRGLVVSGSRDQTIRLWCLTSGSCLSVLRGHTGSVLCLSLSPDGRSLISGSSDSRILIWDLVGGEEGGRVSKSLVGHNMGVLDLCADEKWIVSCSKDTTIRVWHRQTGELYRSLAGHRGPVNAVQLLNDRIVSASGDSLMKLWDVLTGEVLRVFSGHERGLACVKLFPSGKLLASGSNDRTVRIWDATTGECLKVLEGHTDLVRSLAIDEEGGRVVSASYDRTTRVWDWRQGTELLKFKGHSSLVFDVAYSPTRIISSSHDQRILSMDFGDGLDTRLFL